MFVHHRRHICVVHEQLETLKLYIISFADLFLCFARIFQLIIPLPLEPPSLVSDYYNA